MLATNRSCLLVQALLHFAGFHKQPSLGKEVCGSRSTSSIELEITIFGKPLLYFLFLASLFFFGGQKIFVSCIIGSHRSQSEYIAAQTCATLLRARRLFLRRLGLLVSIGAHTSRDIERC